MDWAEIITVGLAILAFVGSIVGTSVFLTWRLSTLATELRKSIGDVATELRELVNTSRDQVDAKIIEAKEAAYVSADNVRREFGETAKAMQSKVHEVEVWARDEFVRKGSFLLVNAETKAMIQSQGERIEKRLERMENKLDATRSDGTG